jgi:hypothetical protein
MKVGDLVKLKAAPGPYGFILKIDKEYYGARQAFKIYAPLERGKAVRGNMIDGYGPTQKGIQDRVLVDWITFGCEYIESKQLEIVSEKEE